MQKCAVCGKKIIDVEVGLCSTHLDAYRKVLAAYPVWLGAYGKLTTSDFLGRLSALSETGERAREIAEFLLQNPARWK